MVHLPINKASNGLQVGSLTTQTDVKNRWAGGSIRSAIVTCLPVAAQQLYSINAATAATGTFTPTWPTVVATFNIGGTIWTAALGSFSGADRWLSGPLCVEARKIVTPTSSGTPHPQLQVIFDIRSYSNGHHRIDWCVQNVRNLSTMDTFVCNSFTLTINGVSRISQALTVYGFTRPSYLPLWETVASQESIILHDFASAIAAGVLPEITAGSNITQDTSNVTAPSGWGINQFATMTPDMAAGGYRKELSPLTEWQARFLKYQDAGQRRAVLIHGRASGCWSNHLLNSDGVTLWKTTNPGDTAKRFDIALAPGVQTGCLAPTRSDGRYRGRRSNVAGGFSDVNSDPNNEHYLNLSSIPYLVTGDRYYLDQQKIWANYAVFSVSTTNPNTPEPVYQPTFNRSRQGVKGLLWTSGLTREFGHPLIVLVEAAGSIPDTDPDQSYFRTLVQNQLDAVGDYVVNRVGPGGCVEAMGYENFGSNLNNVDVGPTKTLRMSSWWRMAYTCWGVYRAGRLGLWTLGDAAEFRNRIVRPIIKFINDPGPHNIPTPSYPQVADDTGAALNFYGSPGDPLTTFYAANYTNPSRNVNPKVGVSITRVGTVATIQYTGLNFQTQYGSISGANEAGFNVSNVLITRVDNNRATYVVPNSGPTVATGVITATPLGWYAIGTSPPQGYHGVEMYFALSAGIVSGVSGAQAAQTALMAMPGMTGDLLTRCGHAIK